MAFITNFIIAIIAIIVIIFFCVYRLTKVVFGLDTGFNWRKSFFYTRASCRSKNIVKSRWWVHLRFGWHPSKTCVKHRLWPPQVSDADATEPHIRPKVYIRHALPEEPSGIGTAHADQTIAWPKHGDALRSHGTFLHASDCVFTWFNPLRFITCPGTIPKPTSWRTTSCIHRQHPVVGRRERQEMCCAGGTV